MLLSYSINRRYAACFIIIVLLYSLQKYGEHQQPYKVLREPQTGFPAAIPIPGATEAGLTPLQDSSLPTLDRLIASDPNHYPPWNGYKDKDYDPNRWHFLPLHTGYYECAVNDSASEPLVSYSPYEPTDLPTRGTACVRPRGVRMNESTADLLHAYSQTCENFPQPLFGSYEAVGLDHDVCFDRFARYGPYGLGGENSVASSFESTIRPYDIEWNNVSWGALQRRCVAENLNDFVTMETPETPKELPSRSAVLIRTWDSYKYEENDLQAVRSLVSELSLQSRGQYEVFLFVHVKDNSLPIWTDQKVYDDMLRQSVPEEFQDMAVLWSEAQCAHTYPQTGTNEVYWQQWQAMQLFAAQHQEFDFFWNWEMDMRYIGHHLHLLSKMTSFAARQPRKYLWERSSRYYLVGLHETWAKFAEWVASVVPSTLSTWGPIPTFDTISDVAVIPSSAVVDDDFTNAVGDEADLITSLPLFNPENTWWSHRDKMWNFSQGSRTPRRVYINTFSRLSRRLLETMDAENKLGRSMASEMWPATVALHYGLKAVYAPHPIWSSRKWPVRYADSVFNAGSALTPSSGRDAVYNPDREHNFGSLSWYFWSLFPGTLYRRFLGWDIADEVGNVTSLEVQAQRRLCLPAMLLHPVKHVSFEDRQSFRP